MTKDNENVLEPKKQPAKRIKQIADDLYEYSDGSVRNAKGQLKRRPPYAAPLITEETASALAKQSHEAMKQKRQQAIARSHDTDDLGHAEAEVIEAFESQIVMNPEAYARDRITAWKETRKAAGMLKSDSEDWPGQANVIVISVPEVADRLGEIIDGEYKDADT